MTINQKLDEKGKDRVLSEVAALVVINGLRPVSEPAQPKIADK